MRVVHITTVPESLVSYLRGQVGFLRARGVELTAISSPGVHLDAFAREHAVEVIGIEMPRRITPWLDLRALVPLVAALRRIRPTIVHAHTPKGGLLGMLAGWMAGTPIRIYHMRGLPLETATGWRRHLLRWTERTSCAVATQVLCVSASLREVALREQLCDPQKIEVLGRGSGQGVDATGTFDPARLPPGTRLATRRKYAIPDDAVVLGFFGRLVRDKGILELIEAWRVLGARYPQLHLMLAGVLEERDALPADAVAALRDDPRVHLLGFDWDTPPLYSAMDIVVLPTYREGFPNVPLEAAAMGKPVVATRVSGCVDAVVDETTGILVAARDAIALATALARYIDAPALRAAHGAAGRARVLAAFRRELVWEAIYRKYGELVARGAPAPAVGVAR
jgi:glycosyltransferase involved in cell wall biosynthesis